MKFATVTNIAFIGKVNAVGLNPPIENQKIIYFHSKLWNSVHNCKLLFKPVKSCLIL